MITVHGDGRQLSRLWARTALGDFVVEATDRGLRSVRPLRGDETGLVSMDQAMASSAGHRAGALAHATVAADALVCYAKGHRGRHEGARDVTGSTFQLAVWEHLRAIPFGATTTYGEIATALGMPGEARAVGIAVGANPVCVLVPCHRVVGADGSLRGFAWGLELKRRLLAHEGSAALPLFADAREG
jgi:O-6-methylguanine DNA methyltransferase